MTTAQVAIFYISYLFKLHWALKFALIEEWLLCLDNKQSFSYMLIEFNMSISVSVQCTDSVYECTSLRELALAIDCSC